MRAILWVLGLVLVMAPAAVAQDLGASKRDAIRQDLRAMLAEREVTLTDWARRTRLPLRVAQEGTGTVEVQRLSSTGRPIYRRTHNIVAAAVTRTDDLYTGTALGIGVTGEGMTLGIWDSGHVRASHQEFGSRVQRIDVADRDDHGTHVAGTLAAGGVREQARGMAYAATLRSYDWNSDVLELTNEAETGLLISNHSYGRISGWDFSDVEGTGAQWYWHGDPAVSLTEDYGFGWYDADAVLFDQAAYNYPYLLPVVSAGNDREDLGPTEGTFRALDANGDWQTYAVANRPIEQDGGFEGTDTISGMAVAKNVLTVGALSNGGRRGGLVADYSSFGPTDDGRVKPDLVGFGARVFSTIAEADNSYGFLSGTSMSAPNVAGSLILLQQYYQYWFGSPMRAATLKALALHTADDLNRTGPDYATGWGRLDALRAAQQIDDALTTPSALLEATLGDGQTYTLPVTVDGDQFLSITLAWTDPPSTRRSITANALNDRRPHLVNDLDLRLTGNGITLFPYVLDVDNPLRDAQPGDNVVDPVEQIRFLAPAGDYVLTVSHKGTLAGGTQPFSIAVSGGYSERRPVPILQFTSSVQGSRVELAWSTPFEQSSGTFQVERAPVMFTGTTRQVGTFQTVGDVTTRGVSGVEQRYAFSDANVEAGRYVYRLRFESGTTSYVGNQTDVAVLSQEDYARVDLYPNPTRDRTLVSFGLEQRRRVQIDVFDALGRRVTSVFDGILDAGRHIQYVTPSDWARGVYVVQIRTREGVRSRSFVYLP